MHFRATPTIPPPPVSTGGLRGGASHDGTGRPCRRCAPFGPHQRSYVFPSDVKLVPPAPLISSASGGAAATCLAQSAHCPRGASEPPLSSAWQASPRLHEAGAGRIRGYMTDPTTP